MLKMADRLQVREDGVELENRVEVHLRRDQR